jgi:hypothetical protein
VPALSTTHARIAHTRARCQVARDFQRRHLRRVSGCRQGAVMAKGFQLQPTSFLLLLVLVVVAVMKYSADAATGDPPNTNTGPRPSGPAGGASSSW